MNEINSDEVVPRLGFATITRRMATPRGTTGGSRSIGTSVADR